MAVKSKARHDLTLRSIKREIQAGRDVAFWLDKAYTHLDSGLFDESDIAAADSMGIWKTIPSYPSITGSPAAMGMQTAL